MNTEQKLVDISMLLAYIKEQIDVSPYDVQNAKLDDIGTTAIEMLSNLTDLSAKLDNTNAEQFAEYKELVCQVSDDIYAKLGEVLDTFTSSDKSLNDTLDKIDEIHSTYVGVLSENVARFNHQIDKYEQDLSTVTQSINAVSDDIKAVDQKIISRADLTEYIQDITRQLDVLMQDDKVLIEAYNTHNETVTHQLDVISNAVAGLGGHIEGITESFPTAVARLDVINVKLDMLVKSMGGETHE